MFIPAQIEQLAGLWNLGDLHRRMVSYRKLRSIYSTDRTLVDFQTLWEMRLVVR